jgi:hypothetical protein
MTGRIQAEQSSQIKPAAASTAVKAAGMSRRLKPGATP